MSNQDHIIHLPNPALVVLVGIQGSGKTSLARRHFAPAEILSSDEFRARVCNDPASQSNTQPALDLLHATLEQRMINKVTSVVDATNTDAQHRQHLLRVARDHDTPAFAVLLDTPREVCAHRIRERGRVIRPTVLEQQAALWPQVLRNVPAEGYAAVHILKADRCARARFVHALPSKDDKDRWIIVERLDHPQSSYRLPVDEIRRHPTLLADPQADPFIVARVAAECACTENDVEHRLSVRIAPGTHVRVRVPHHYPLRLIRRDDSWQLNLTSEQ